MEAYGDRMSDTVGAEKRPASLPPNKSVIAWEEVPMAYIGLDVGTTGSKATVIARDGRALSSAYREYNLRFPAPGHVELRPSDVWEAVKTVLREVAATSGEPIEALAAASFGEAVAHIGRDGKPVCDSIFFTDVRVSGELDDLRAAVDADELMRTSGMPINFMFTLPKLLWMQKNRPELLEKTEKILPYSGYVAYMLSGECTADGSLASRTLLFDRFRGDWNPETLKAFGIPRAWLPDYVPAGHPVGKMLPSVARELGIQGSPIIVSGVHDQIAAALGAGALRPGQAADGIGSAECITSVLPDDMDLKGMFRYNICAEPHAVPGRYLALVFNNTAGAALKWYRDQFAAELRDRCRLEGTSAYDELNKSISEAPSPVLFLPHLGGTGTPHMDAEAKGMLAGLTLSTTASDVYRAILEGMCYEMRLNLELLERFGMRFGALTAGGGGASPEALQLRADILGLPITRTREAQAGTVGMAMLCALATGQFSSFDEAAAALVHPGETYAPDGRFKAQYDERFEQYKRMYSASRAVYGRS